MIFQPGRDAKTIVTGTIHPYRGEWIEFDVEAKPNRDITAGTRVARKRRLSLFVVLRALGYEDEAFLDRFVRHFDFLAGQWEKERDARHRPGRTRCSRSTSALVPASRCRSRRRAPTSRTPSSTRAATTSPASAATS